MTCACGCGQIVRPGRIYHKASHSFRGPKSEGHKAAIAVALRAYYEERWGRLGGKRCPRCHVVKPAEMFGFRSKPNKFGPPCVRGECRACARRWRRHYDSAFYRKHHLRWRYGLSGARYEAMLAEQGGACAICDSPVPGSSRIKHFHVDHCHRTGVIRGLLCSRCNRAIAAMDDDPARLIRAAEYLQRQAMGRRQAGG